MGGRGMMGGMGQGMMARHQAQIPEDYAGLINPLTADEIDLSAAADIYAANCATCHGDGGMGDGPAAASLDPAPAAIAHTSQMLGDDYLFWRISEGGNMDPFNSAMPGWEASFDEETRWELVLYMRALGAGTVTPQGMMGGAAMDPQAAATQEAAMLDTAVTAGVITADEAAAFARIHPLIEEKGMAQQGSQQGNMSQRQQSLLEELIGEGVISQAEADQFDEIHERLVEAGLMR